MTKYDPKLVEFTEKLAALMKEYGATIEVTEECSNWTSYATGLTLEVDVAADDYNGQMFVDIEGTFLDENDFWLTSVK